MSEPQTNIEIEDVLSSIRRLVSQDLRRPQEPALRPAEASELAPETAASPLDEADTLVLGPAQRVEAPEGLVPMPEGDEVPSEALDAVQRDEGPQEGWDEGAEAPMPADPRAPRLAVLIDAENISSALYEPLQTLVHSLGNPIVW